jgi:hypothetical protein
LNALPTKPFGGVSGCVALWEAAHVFLDFALVVADIRILKAVAKLNVQRMI